jgi:hypothetical protein
MEDLRQALLTEEDAVAYLNENREDFLKLVDRMFVLYPWRLDPYESGKASALVQYRKYPDPYRLRASVLVLVDVREGMPKQEVLFPARRRIREAAGRLRDAIHIRQS